LNAVLTSKSDKISFRFGRSNCEGTKVSLEITILLSFDVSSSQGLKIGNFNFTYAVVVVGVRFIMFLHTCAFIAFCTLCVRTLVPNSICKFYKFSFFQTWAQNLAGGPNTSIVECQRTCDKRKYKRKFE
jgi:hypothetical protein